MPRVAPPAPVEAHLSLPSRFQGYDSNVTSPSSTLPSHFRVSPISLPSLSSLFSDVVGEAERPAPSRYRQRALAHGESEVGSESAFWDGGMEGGEWVRRGEGDDEEDAQPVRRGMGGARQDEDDGSDEGGDGSIVGPSD